MKIPNWVPMVNRPWNPAYGETWDAMTPNERRASWLFDAAIVIIVLSLLACSSRAFAADASKPAAPPPPAQAAATAQTAAPQPVPIVLSSEDLTALNEWLQKQPYSFAQPLIAWFSAKEQAAAAALASKPKDPAK